MIPRVPHPLFGIGIYLGSTIASASTDVQQVADHWPMISLVWSGVAGAVLAVVGILRYYKSAMAEVDDRVQRGVAKVIAEHIKNEELMFNGLLEEMKLHKVQFDLIINFLEARERPSLPTVPKLDLNRVPHQ